MPAVDTFDEIEDQLMERVQTLASISFSLNLTGTEEYAGCQNVPGSYHCNCAAGYGGDGHTCAGRTTCSVPKGDSVAWWSRRWIRDQEVAGSTPSLGAVGQQP